LSSRTFSELQEAVEARWRNFKQELLVSQVGKTRYMMQINVDFDRVCNKQRGVSQQEHLM